MPFNMSEWRAKNADRLREQGKAHWAANRIAILAQVKLRRLQDPAWAELCRQRNRIYQEPKKAANAQATADRKYFARIVLLMRDRMRLGANRSGAMPPRLSCQSGVYLIVGPNGRRYVGSALNISKRCCDHWKSLTEGHHHSVLLQRAWNKHGGARFLFSVLMLVEDKTQLVPTEQYWIDYFGSADAKRGYNVAPKAGSQLGVIHSAEARERTAAGLRGRKLSDERKAKNGEWWRGLCDVDRAAIKDKRSKSLKLAHAARSPERKAAINKKIAAAHIAFHESRRV